MNRRQRSRSEQDEDNAVARKTYYGAVNLTSRPIDVTPTMRIMPYTGRSAAVGEPDLSAGNGCKKGASL